MPVDGISKIVLSGAADTKELMLRSPGLLVNPSDGTLKTKTFWGSDEDTTTSDPLRFDNSKTAGWDTPQGVDNVDAVAAGQSGLAWAGSIVPGRPFLLPFLRRPGQDRDAYDDLFWSGLVTPLAVTFATTTGVHADDRYLLSCKPEASPGAKNRWHNTNLYRMEAAWPWYVTAPSQRESGTVPRQPPFVLYYFDITGATKGSNADITFTAAGQTYEFELAAPAASFIVCPAKPFLLNMHAISGVEPPPYLQPGQTYRMTEGGTGTVTMKQFRNYNSPPGA